MNRQLRRFQSRSSLKRDGNSGGAEEDQDETLGGKQDSLKSLRRSRKRIQIKSAEIVRGVEGLIGNTPLMRINSLSDATGCEILGKAEFLNPAGSPKDRVALQILNDAEAAGLLHPHTGSRIFEGTVGSTGISLTTLARAKGYDCSIVIPDDVASEKVELLKKLGADVLSVRPRGIVDPKHFVNEARAQAQAFGSTELVGPHAQRFDPDDHTIEREDLVVSTQVSTKAIREGSSGNNYDPDALEKAPRGFFADQFENDSNFAAHFNGTGPEIWEQTGGQIDAFVAGAGTGGTLAGVGAFLKRIYAENLLRQSDYSQHHYHEQSGSYSSLPDEGGSTLSSIFLNPLQSISAALSGSDSYLPGAGGGVQVVLADPQGSGLYNKVKHGVMYSETEAEGTRRRYQVDTMVEGIGLNRLTHNFRLGLDCVDDAERVTDDEAVRMSRWLVLNDGLFLGSSSAVNCVAAVRTALKLKKTARSGRRPVVVTILCDGGARHLSKFHNDDYVTNAGCEVSSDISDILQQPRQ
ncbi:Cysteine synthase 2 [Tilletia horrida]|uniref:cysteine synthase n=1 Tax=Tilletia horrida TaxID=155126 RepID=A0AAN6GPU4_9BASI|nr:Cysteine synthase 2 [Tilletia horrida]